MKKFRYGLDRLCLAACIAYGFNRWLLKPWWGGTFLHGYANDLFLIPAALPWVLWLHRRMGLRRDDRRPTWGEILVHLVLWSVLFEVVGPHFVKVTADGWDVVAYATGALAAGWWWNRRRAFRSCHGEESAFSNEI